MSLINISDSQFEIFYQGQKLVKELWNNKDFYYCENEALHQILEGNPIPNVYKTLAMLYRKQKRYVDEVKILKLAIKVQEVTHNPGVAKRDFKKRLIRATELRDNI